MGGIWTPDQVDCGRMLRYGSTDSANQRDPYWANVVSLLNFDGPNGENVFVDETGKVWTTTGNVTYSTSSKQFGVSSALFNGSISDYLTTPNSSDWAFGSGQFTVECGVNSASTMTNCGFLSQWFGAAGSQAWAFWMNSNKLSFRFWDGTAYHDTESAWSNTPGTWHHVAATRDASGVVRVFADGSIVAAATFPQSINSATSVLRAGGIEGFSLPFSGRMDSARITKGVARYVAAFTPPTKAFYAR